MLLLELFLKVQEKHETVIFFLNITIFFIHSKFNSLQSAFENQTVSAAHHLEMYISWSWIQCTKPMNPLCRTIYVTAKVSSSIKNTTIHFYFNASSCGKYFNRLCYCSKSFWSLQKFDQKKKRKWFLPRDNCDWMWRHRRNSAGLLISIRAERPQHVVCRLIGWEDPLPKMRRLTHPHVQAVLGPIHPLQLLKVFPSIADVDESGGWCWRKKK